MAETEEGRRSHSDWRHDDYEPLCNTKVKIWSVLAVIAVIVSVLIACIASSVHKIDEGNVGIYFKHGALLDGLTHPGVHWMAPFVTEVRQVSIRPKTDTLPVITSITKDGIQNRFTEVQVRWSFRRTKLLISFLFPFWQRLATHLRVCNQFIFLQ